MANREDGDDSTFLQRAVDGILGTILGRVLYDVSKAGDLQHIALAVALLAIALMAWRILKRRWLLFSALLAGTFLGMVLANR